MANYRRLNIRLYPIKGFLNSTSIISKIKQLKAENNIYESVEVYFEKKFVEIRFTLKWFPNSLDEIFSLDEYDIWIIFSDEGGGSDGIKFLTKHKILFNSFDEKAIYSLRCANLAARFIVKDLLKFFETKDDLLTLSLGSRSDFFSRQI